MPTRFARFFLPLCLAQALTQIALGQMGDARTTLAPSPGDQARSVAGAWNITAGKNPGSSTNNYRGTVDIAARDNGVIAMKWNIPGGASYGGIGFANGKVLAAGYSDGSPMGVAIYEEQGDKFVGAWTGSMTKGEIGYETLQTTGAGTGIFKIIRGDNPDGGKYGGEVVMVKKGDIYELTWRGNGPVTRGIGMRVGNFLVVGWTPGKSVGVVCYQVKNDGTRLEGVWTGLGASRLGAETLDRR
jgi:hypothetical protein